MSKIAANNFVHRTTLSQAQVVLIIEALEEYGVSSGKIESYKELINKFQLLAVKGDSGYAKPAYEKKGRVTIKNISASELGFEDAAKVEAFDADAFMREMEAKSGDRRKEDIDIGLHRRATDTDSEAASALFSDLSESEIDKF